VLSLNILSPFFKGNERRMQFTADETFSISTISSTRQLMNSARTIRA
jgi:hypothetical protein